MFFEQYSHEPNIAVVRYWVSIAATRSRDTTVPRADRYTIADIALYAYTRVAGEGGFDLSGYPAIGRWLDRVASQPGYVSITG